MVCEVQRMSSETGLIFDIKEMAVHDGANDGILKGMSPALQVVPQPGRTVLSAAADDT